MKPSRTLDFLGPAVTLTEAAEHLGITRQALYDALSRGRLQGTLELTPRGPVWWISLESVRRYRRTRQPRGSGQHTGS